MSKKRTTVSIPDEAIISKIYLVRGQKVMLDSDLAALYGVETKRLKEQVKRNLSRFPVDYMFKLSESEYKVLRSQIASSNSGRGGTRYLPLVFTEHGVLQLSNVLKSKRAEKVSFIIIDVFVRFRKMLLDNTELRLMLRELQQKTNNNIKNIEVLFQYLDGLLEKKVKPRKKIGYKLPK